MRQITNTLLMIRPARFGFNEETAESNSFQAKDETPEEQIQKDALLEFDSMVKKLNDHNINTLVIDDIPPYSPDAVFPNNWLSTHENKVLITYAMASPIRRLELREDILRKLEDLYGYNKEYNFQHYIIEDGLALEGTGSMILDRENRICYACLSPRTSIQLLSKFGILMDYKIIYFHAFDKNDELIYHTNVMMALGEELAVICLECIQDEEEKKNVVEQLTKNGKTIVDISLDQVNEFAGNMLEVRSDDLTRYMIMSSKARKSLTANQLETISNSSKILDIEIPTIEKFGGGSVRCMLAEIFRNQS